MLWWQGEKMSYYVFSLSFLIIGIFWILYKELNKFNNFYHIVCTAAVSQKQLRNIWAQLINFPQIRRRLLPLKKPLLVLARLRSSMQMSARIFNHNELFPLEVWVWLLFLVHTLYIVFFSWISRRIYYKSLLVSLWPCDYTGNLRIDFRCVTL